MGNSMALCISEGKLQEKEKLILQVMKTDENKILEFNTSILVKDLLANYPTSYVGLFKEATQRLPLNYELKVGDIYYLLPNYCSTAHHHDHDGSGLGDRDIERNLRSLVTCNIDDDRKGKKIMVQGPKRVKVLLTKEQLQRLISKQMGAGYYDQIKWRCHSIGSISMSPFFVPKLKAVSE